MRSRRIGVFILVVLGLGLAASAGYGLYQAGYTQGLTAEGAEIVVGRGYYPGLYGFGVIAIMFKALFAFLLFGLLAKLFFFRRWAHRGYWAAEGPGQGGPGHAGPGGWSGPRKEEFRSRMESHLEDWHRKAHGEVGEDKPDES